MKTSNKILLGFLLCGFGYLTCAQIALHVKYKNNDYISTQQYNARFYEELPFENIKHISINSIAQCYILPSASVKLSLEKGKVEYVKYAVHGDTLIIAGQYPTPQSANNIINTSPQNVRLYLPAGMAINARGSNIDVMGSAQTAAMRSFNFQLDNTNLFTRYNYYSDSLDKYFDSFVVVAKNHSEVTLFKRDHFKHLDIQLAQSLINDREALIEDMKLATDSNSVLIVSGRNLNKLNANAIRQ